MIRLLFSIFTLSLVVVTSQGQNAWKLDKAHSQVIFSVSHMVFSEVTGAFRDFDVTFESTKSDFSNAKVSAIIKSNSIDTQNERRDGHLKSDDFLNAEKFPEIKFKSSKIEKTGPDSYKISGDLTVRDVTKPVVLDARFRGEINDPWGNKRIGFRATTTIDRFEYGAGWNKVLETGGLIAGKDIEITLLMQFTQPKQQG